MRAILGITLTMVCAASALAQTGKPAETATYEVASIRPNTTGSGSTSIDTNNNTYTASNVSLRGYLQNAYSLQAAAQLVGLPPWASAAHYDIRAKMDDETEARLKAMKADDRYKEEKKMMMGLLTERFAIQIHHETRQLPLYELVLAKGGSKLKPATPGEPNEGSMSVHNTKMNATGVDMEALTYFLSGQVGRKVVDKTGLTGKFDLTLEWTRDDATNGSAADGSAEKAPGLFTALLEQMGLKLESTKGPVDTVVIDHIEQPSEN